MTALQTWRARRNPQPGGMAERTARAYRGVLAIPGARALIAACATSPPRTASSVSRSSSTAPVTAGSYPTHQGKPQGPRAGIPDARNWSPRPSCIGEQRDDPATTTAATRARQPCPAGYPRCEPHATAMRLQKCARLTEGNRPCTSTTARHANQDHHVRARARSGQHLGASRRAAAPRPELEYCRPSPRKKQSSEAAGGRYAIGRQRRTTDDSPADMAGPAELATGRDG